MSAVDRELRVKEGEMSEINRSADEMRERERERERD